MHIFVALQFNWNQNELKLGFGLHQELRELVTFAGIALGIPPELLIFVKTYHLFP